MWILWKMRPWKCEFCEKWDFQMWILWRIRLWKCEFLCVHSWLVRNKRNERHSADRLKKNAKCTKHNFSFHLQDTTTMYKAIFVLIISLKNVMTNPSVTQGDTSDIFSSTFQMQALLQAEIEVYQYFTNSSVNSTQRQKSTQFIRKFTFWKSYFWRNLHFQSLILHKIHIFKISFLTKFTISKTDFSQNSHFQSLIFH